MMDKQLNYGLIGAGMMGREHIRNLGLIPGSRVTAIADPDSNSLDQTAALLDSSTQCLSDWHELIGRDDIDALIIASPNDTHFEIVEALVKTKRSLPLLVEKPICVSLEQCQRLRSISSEYKSPIWVAMEYRYMLPVQEVVNTMHRGDIGTIHMLTLREHRYPFLSKVGDWNRFAIRTGGTMVEKCCHFFDLMRLAIADEPVRIYASGAMDVNHRQETYAGRTPDIIDNGYVIVDFSHGTRAMLELCMFAEGSEFQEHFSVVGDRAKIECFIPGPARFSTTQKELEGIVKLSPRDRSTPSMQHLAPDAEILDAGSHFGSTYYEHLKFRQAILENMPVEVTLEDGLRAVEMGLAAEQSIREGGPVNLNFESIIASS